MRLKSVGILAALLSLATSLFGQSSTGELRLKITDPAGLGVKSSIELVSEANQYRQTFATDDGGNLAARRLPFGVYRVEVERQGFAPLAESLEVRSAIPAEYTIQLALAAVNTSVTVNDADTLLDPHRAGASNQIGTQM